MRPLRATLPALLTGLAVAATGPLALTAPAFAQSATGCTPNGNANDETFFTGNSLLGSTSAPGEIAKCRAITLSDGDFPASTRGYQLIYRSENAQGGAIPVSGTILVPPGGGSGLISLATGTVGMNDKAGTTLWPIASCAPSAGLPDGDALVSNAAARYLNLGYAVAVTDYEGLRTPGEHPYLNGASEGKTQLDVARAARLLPGESLGGAKKTVLTGYSQGGHSTLWAAQLRATYAPGLPVVGAVAGAAPVDLELTRQSLDGNFASGLLSYVIQSLANQHPSLNLLGRLDSSGASFVSNLAPKCSVAMGLATSGWYRSWANLWKPGQDPATLPAFQNALKAGNVPTATPTVPLFMFHGVDDGIVPLAPHEALAKQWFDAGAPVTWRPVPGAHLWSSNENGQDLSDGWIADRFAGLPL